MSGNYTIDLRDIHFALFEHLNIQEFQSSKRYGDFAQDDYAMMIQEAFKFCDGVIAPLNVDSDRIGSTFANGEVTTPPGFKEAWKACAENGWIGAGLNPEYGGMGLPGTVGAVLMELFLGACTSFQLTMGLTTGVGHLVEVFGTDEQKAKFTEKLYTGTWAGTMVLTEPGAGSNLGDVRTTATKVEGSDHYLIEGTKCFITAGEHDMTENIIHAVLARLPNGPGATKDLGLFLVPKFILEDDGSLGERNDVVCGGIEHKMGIHGSPTCTLNFGEKGACKGWLLGPDEFQGMRMMFQMMNEARIMTGIQGVALSAVAYQAAVSYTKEREQGPAIEKMGDRSAPSVAIINHADVRRMLLNQKSHVEGMRALAYYAASLHDRSEIAEDEAEAAALEARMALLTPLVKAWCTDKGFEMCSEAIQCFGGYGFCGDYPVEQYTRDARIAPLYEGTNFIQAADLIGRKLRLNDGATFKGLLDEIEAWINEHKETEGLQEIAENLGKAHGALGMATMELMKSAGEGDFAFTMSVGTRFLHAMAETVVGWLLGQQALIAQKALAGSPSEDDARFYTAKVLTARFFANNVLPGVRMKAAVIKNHDTTVFEMDEAGF